MLFHGIQHFECSPKMYTGYYSEGFSYQCLIGCLQCHFTRLLQHLVTSERTTIGFVSYCYIIIIIIIIIIT
jgi:hypothetical protein